MSLGPVCGLWPSSRGFVAAVVDPDGALITVATLPVEAEEQIAWLSGHRTLCSPGPDLVLSEPTARRHAIGRYALASGYRVWVAPMSLVTPISRAAWWRPTPRQIATLLARLPKSRALRASLRRLPPDPGPLQQCLFSWPLGNARPRALQSRLNHPEGETS
jgi:hypothetical protein